MNNSNSPNKMFTLFKFTHEHVQQYGTSIFDGKQKIFSLFKSDDLHWLSMTRGHIQKEQKHANMQKLELADANKHSLLFGVKTVYQATCSDQLDMSVDLIEWTKV